MSTKAIWNNRVLAESSDTIKLEGNHYFPADSIEKEFFESSDLHSTCPHKGVASYHNIVVDGKTNKDAAWYYPTPKKGYENISNYLAFWKGVEIVAE